VATLNLAAVVLAVFLATEWFIARKARTTLLYSRNPHYRHALRPNQTYVRDGFRYVVGPHGLRGEAPEMPKPEGVVRVAVMGGSSVFDHRVATSWPERVEARLRASGLESVEVFNAGVPGFSTREMIPFFERKVSDFDPDVVVAYTGWNDVKSMKAFRRSVQLEPYREPRAGPDPYAWLTAARPWRNVYALPVLWEKIRLRTSFLEENAAPTPPSTRTSSAASPPPAWEDSAGLGYYRDNLRAFTRAVRAEGALPVFVAEANLYTRGLAEEHRGAIAYHYTGLDHDELVHVTELLHRTAQRVAESRGAPFIDPRAELNGRPECFFDHVHLTRTGSTRLADMVAPALAEVLRERRLAPDRAIQPAPAGDRSREEASDATAPEASRPAR